MKKILFAVNLLAAILVSAKAHAVAIGAAGVDSATLADWRTTTTAKSLDIDYDNIYGTAGYLAFATGASMQYVGGINALTKLDGLPSYLTVSANGADTSASDVYAYIDDPTQTPGPSVADIHSGLAFRQSASANVAANLFDLTFGASTPSLLRVGVFENSGAGNITSYTLSDGVTSATQLFGSTFATGIVRYAFFNVSNAANTTLTLSVMTSVAGAVGLSGFTFDVVPEPSSFIMLSLGIVGIGRIRRKRAL